MACITMKHVFVNLMNKCHMLNNVIAIAEGVRNRGHNLRYSSATHPTEQVNDEVQEPEYRKEVSRAMQEYLKRSKEHELFIQQQLKEYEKGKEFLADIMKVNPSEMSQRRIDEAIAYLFPSGLHEKLARPMMKHPYALFKKHKEAQFDISGRPFHFLFYTSKPNYTEVLHNCATYLETLQKKSAARGPTSKPPTIPLNTVGTTWIKKDRLEQILVEKLLDIEYDRFIEAMERLISHPFSYEAAEFILKYRISQKNESNTKRIPRKKRLKDGKFFVVIKNCRKKTCKGKVMLTSPGTGEIKINGKGLDFFSDMDARSQVSFAYPFFIGYC